MGVLKGLITRYTNQGYTISIDYTEPKKVTEGSIRRVNQVIHEVTRQHDVQVAREQVRARETARDVQREADRLKRKIRGYQEGSLLGHVGMSDTIGKYKPGGSGHRLTMLNGNNLILAIDEALDAAGGDKKKLKQLKENFEEERAILDEYAEEYTLAVYNSKYAKWGGGFSAFEAAYEAFKYALLHDVKEGW